MTVRLLNDQITEQVRQVFTDMKEPVGVYLFEDKGDCQYCEDTAQLLQEVTELSDKLSLDVYDLNESRDLAERFHIDKAPGFLLVGKDGDQVFDYGIRYFGIPAGHEFSSLIHDLLVVSSRDSGLKENTRRLLKDLKKPVHLQVFVTPTCPYCPQAVLLAHQMAIESPMIEAEMIEATEFPELADRFNVSGVPQTTINQGAGTVVGAVPEEHLMAEILRAAA